jgi:hypothetical protein
VSDLVNDALAVLEALTGPGAPERDGPAADALGLLALVAGQDVEPAEDSDGTDGRWRIARKVAPDRVISTVDTEARHTRKSKSKRRDGFRGHVATEPGTGLITDCEMTMAAGDGSTDAENGVKMAGRDRFHRATAQPQAGPRDEPGLEVCGDSAYGSGEARADYRDAGHDTVIKPGPLRPAVPGGARRAHHRRFRRGRGAGHRDLPGRAGPADERQADRDVRRGLRGLPAAGAVHHIQGWPVDDHPPA